jgi:hypothetical protein
VSTRRNCGELLRDLLLRCPHCLGVVFGELLNVTEDAQVDIRNENLKGRAAHQPLYRHRKAGASWDRQVEFLCAENLLRTLA